MLLPKPFSSTCEKKSPQDVCRQLLIKYSYFLVKVFQQHIIVPCHGDVDILYLADEE